MPSYQFPKKERLSRKKLWEAVFDRGTRYKAYPLALYVLPSPLPEEVSAQAGFAVPKRNFKKAVKRNRIKRLMREAYRLEKHHYFNTLERPFALVFLYLGKDTPDFEQVRLSMKEVLKKFNAYETTIQNQVDPAHRGSDHLPDRHGV